MSSRQLLESVSQFETDQSALFKHYLQCRLDKCFELYRRDILREIHKLTFSQCRRILKNRSTQA